MKVAAHPYLDLPQNAFWRTAVAGRPAHGLEDIYRRKFALAADDKIATAGSCFAQHISRHLKANGYGVLDVEPAPQWLPAELHAQYGFSTYSARYGNIYTVAQLLQLARECLGRFRPADLAWAKGGKVFDALRPAVEPEGYADEEELRLHRRYHLGRVRTMFAEADVLIFTLGLTEAWLHKPSGTVYPTCPGVIAGAFDAAQHGFVNFDVLQMEAMFRAFVGCLEALRPGRGPPRIILTVSPVPLTATASGKHVLAANTYSKAALRALAGLLADRHDFVDYFPSFEIVTNPAARGTFFDANLRTVTAHGVEQVMRIFFAAHGEQAGKAAAAQASPAAPPTDAAANTEVQCEEAMLEAFASG
jgi:hypothetical protein